MPGIEARVIEDEGFFCVKILINQLDCDMWLVSSLFTEREEAEKLASALNEIGWSWQENWEGPFGWPTIPPLVGVGEGRKE